MRDPDFYSETEPLSHQQDEQDDELERVRIESLRRSSDYLTPPPFLWNPLDQHDDD